MTRYPPHVLATRLILHALGLVVPEGWFVAKEDPMTTTDSVPEPDCAIIRGTMRDYSIRHPGLGEMALVVEVADSSLSRDRGSKMRLYARANIPVYWLVNLISGRIEVYTDPTGPADRPSYRVGWSFGPGDEVPVVVDGREIARIPVRGLLP
jgi:Uma2 family endonuclease